MYRLLVVDDEELIVKKMCSTIEQNFEVELYRAFSAFEALELLREMRFDVVITDINMPQMNGLELLERIKRTWPKCHVILLTAYDVFDYVYQSSKYDHVDYILKVESTPVVIQTIQAALDRLKEEQNQEQLFIRMGRDFEKLKPRLVEDLLARLFKYNEALPSQEELSGYGFGLQLSQPVMLAVGMLDTAHSAQKTGYPAGILTPVTAMLEKRGFHVQTAQLGNHLIWMVQHPADSAEDLHPHSVAALDIFESVPETLRREMELSIMLATSEDFVPWNRLSSIYERCALVLEQSRNDSGMRTIPSEPSPFSLPDAPGSMSMDETMNLWELIATEQHDRFIQLLSEKLQPMGRVGDVTQLGPSAITSALTLLYLNLASLHNLTAVRDDHALRVLGMQSRLSGSEWSAQVVGIFDSLLNQKKEERKTGADLLVSKVNQYIAENYRSDIHLTSIAQAFHYSPSYLSRIYKEATGASITDTVSNYRLKCAKQLLSTSGMSISDIATKVGFYSNRYFIEVFRKKTGVTPSQYRKNPEL